jgi:peptide subunit release factor 1 (eRF1)
MYLFSRLFIKIYLKSIFDNINNLKTLYIQEKEKDVLSQVRQEVGKNKKIKNKKNKKKLK